MAKKFMDPHDVPQIPGTEGWERMYPYQYQFSKEDPERAAFESNQSGSMMDYTTLNLTGRSISSGTKHGPWLFHSIIPATG